MLDGAGNADGDVEIRCDDLAGLPHLVIIWHKTRVDGRAGSADSRVEFVGECVDQFEVLAIAHAASAGDDHARGGEFGAGGFSELLADKERQGRYRLPEAMFSTAAEPPVAAAGSKAVVRMVMTFILSLDCTVAKALPA